MRSARPGGRQAFFAACVFVPAMLFFFSVPVMVFRIPMVVWRWDGPVYVPARDVWYALAVSAVWFTLALGAVLWPARRTAPARPWTPAARWLGFLLFSAGGVAVAGVNAWCGLPSAWSAALYWLAFAPVPGFLTGVALLLSPSPPGTRPLLWALTTLDLLAVVLLPISLSKVTPAALAVIAILYGLRTGPARRAAVPMVVLLLPLLLVAIPGKEFIREAVYEGDAFRKAEAGCAFPYTLRAEALAATGQTYLDRARRVFQADQGLRPYVASLGRRVPLGGYALARALIRLNRLSDLSYVVSQTPAQVPFAQGATYRPFLSKLVPRVLWRSKPVDETGQLYGHRYGFLAPTDRAHSANLTLVAEAWMNGGWPVVALTALFFGGVVRAIWVYLVGDSGAEGNALIGAIAVAAAAHQESNLSAVVGGVVEAAILYVGAETLVRRAGAWVDGRAGAARTGPPR